MTDLEWAGKTVLQQKLGTSLGTKQPSCPAWNVAGGGVARRRHKEGVQRPLVPLFGGNHRRRCSEHFLLVICMLHQSDSLYLLNARMYSVFTRCSFPIAIHRGLETTWAYYVVHRAIDSCSAPGLDSGPERIQAILGDSSWRLAECPAQPELGRPDF